MLRVSLEGTALHAGVPARVELRRVPGPIRFVREGRAASLEEMRLENVDRGVALAGPGGAPKVDLCEHLLAALGGLGVFAGVEVEVEGPELPLLDGGALAFAEALRALELPRGVGCLVVAREAELRHGAALYRLRPADGLRVEVTVDFPPPVGRESACWDGDPDDFVARVAPARTFGWRDEHRALLARERARGADQAGLLVFDDGKVMSGCRPAEPGECARHKLLDLIGDLTVHGGLARGRVEAERPGHAATHACLAAALREGSVVRELSSSGRGAR
jgi:UDP-3-O-[3-hydroxymyristoyl] N-acetylglucosamine deacetylase